MPKYIFENICYIICCKQQRSMKYIFETEIYLVSTFIHQKIFQMYLRGKKNTFPVSQYSLGEMQMTAY